MVVVSATMVACSAGDGTAGSVASSSAPTAAAPSSAPEALLDIPLDACRTTSAEGGTAHPDVVDATLEPKGDDLYDVAVTLRSPCDSADHYVDAWRIASVDGSQTYGTRALTHDYASEQPFTRSLNDVEIPDGVEQVRIEARDQITGWSSAALTVDVPADGS